jgi:DNA-binding transcriptional MerR regulator
MKKIKDRVVIRENNIFRGDAFSVANAMYEFSEGGKSFSEFINTKTDRLTGATELTYRVISHWEKQGLITSERRTEKAWRKYSILDILWISIIIELRKFGFPLDKIFLVKRNLEIPEWEREKQFPLLEFYAAMAMAYKYPVFLLVFPNGDVEPATDKEYQYAIMEESIGNHITISINSILQKMLPEQDLKPDYKITHELSEEEVDLLFMIRMCNYENIKIKLSNGKIETLDATENLSNQKRIGEILKEGNYQDIEIKQKNGKVVNIKRTAKKRYKK